MNVGLLITTFNRPDTLDLLFKTVANQSRVPDHIVVCDDGSYSATADVVTKWARRLPISHAWQSDCGFRAARARNLGISKTEAEYIIWVDGDCLLPSSFIENHLRLAQRGFLVAGGRHLLSEAEAKSLLDETVSIRRAFLHWKFGSVSLGVLRDLHFGAWETVRTCNLGVYRDDLAEIGGFDESYEGWGREDSDLVVRLIHRGIKVRSGRFAACVAHLHHRERTRYQLSENDTRFRTCLSDPNHIQSQSSVLTQL